MSTPTAGRPQFFPGGDALDDLELVRHGVVDLAGVALPVPASGAEVIDAEGVPVARLGAASTTDEGRPGDIVWLGHLSPRPFERLYLSPEQVHATRSADEVTAVVARPLRRTDVAAIRDWADGRPVLVLVPAGPSTNPHAHTVATIRSVLNAARALHARVVTLPLNAARAHADPARQDAIVDAWAAGPVAWLDRAGSALAGSEVIQAGHGTSGGVVVMLTGLSGSGKSTIARAVREAVLEEDGRAVTLLDGDVVRRQLSAGLTFSPEDRDTNVLRIGWVAAEIAGHGGLAICAQIAPHEQTREAVRAMVAERGGDLVLVHVATPLDVCEGRDRKGLYAQARAGAITGFTGVDAPYEVPADADLTLDTSRRSVAACRDAVLALLRERGHLIAADPEWSI
ncbi:adenylyl-sulfate kinase [Janibacter sp. G56]|uniref:adenylyl-sulfate kinase n=1 Tax=Janibacter sp. G56 TaxID=3418717 RepID=UPI003CFF32BC